MKKIISIVRKETPVCLIPNIVYSQVATYFGKASKPLLLHMVRPDEWEMPRPKLPTVVWIMGGAWEETAPLKFAPEFSYLAKAGYNVVLLDYRVNNEGIFPAQIQDVKTAIRFLRAHADEYGVDEERIAVMGDSAGGYLAAMVGVIGEEEEFQTDQWKGYDSSVKAVIDMYGPVSFKEMIENPGEIDRGRVLTPTRKFLGEGGYNDPETLRRSNPMNYISEETPPFLLLHGTSDEQIPYSQSVMFYEALQEKQVPADLYLLDGVYHARSEFWQDEVKEIILDFLKKYL